jgi:hypothetical protein
VHWIHRYEGYRLILNCNTLRHGQFERQPTEYVNQYGGALSLLLFEIGEHFRSDI